MEEEKMKIEQVIRIFAGSLVLIGLGLSQLYSLQWLWLTAFVGANLLQSGFTKWCLAESILKKVFPSLER